MPSRRSPMAPSIITVASARADSMCSPVAGPAAALGSAGRDITSLAAADYFFRNKYRRAYFSHFTNLVPMERSGSIRRSMDTAQEVLRRGRSMVVFPEGTRSLDGAMADFLPSLGYLALRAEVGQSPFFLGEPRAEEFE